MENKYNDRLNCHLRFYTPLYPRISQPRASQITGYSRNEKSTAGTREGRSCSQGKNYEGEGDRGQNR